jgi:hypothetical protein
MPLVHPAIVSGGNENHGQPLNLDASGNLLVNIAQGSISASSGAQYNSSAPTFTNGSTNALQADVNGNLKVNLASGTVNATSAATYNSTPPTFSNASSNALQADSHGSLKTSPSDASGAAMGVLANPIRTDPTGTTTQPVSAASLPLPSGAATSAKQAQPGTAGTASADVLTVQGIASMTALKVDLSGTGANTTAVKTDGSAVTQPVSIAATVSVKQIAPTMNVGQVSIGTTATQILAANANRMRLLVTNLGTTDVYLGGSGVTSSTGHLLKGIAGYPVALRFTGAVYGITASGSQSVTYAEETN